MSSDHPTPSPAPAAEGPRANYAQTRPLTDDELDTAARKLVDTLHAESRADHAAGLVAELRNRFWARAAFSGRPAAALPGAEAGTPDATKWEGSQPCAECGVPFWRHASTDRGHWFVDARLAALASDVARLHEERDQAWSELAAIKLLCPISPDTVLPGPGALERVRHAFAQKEKLRSIIEASEATRMQERDAAEAENARLTSEVRALTEQRDALLDSIGAGFDQRDIEARGLDFTAWEVGFNDAVSAVRARLASPSPTGAPAVQQKHEG